MQSTGHFSRGFPPSGILRPSYWSFPRGLFLGRFPIRFPVGFFRHLGSGGPMRRGVAFCMCAPQVEFLTCAWHRTNLRWAQSYCGNMQRNLKNRSKVQPSNFLLIEDRAPSDHKQNGRQTGGACAKEKTSPLPPIVLAGRTFPPRPQKNGRQVREALGKETENLSLPFRCVSGPPQDNKAKNNAG